MSDKTIAIKITADARQVAAGVGQAKKALEALSPLLDTLKAGFQSLSADMRQAMAGGATATKALIDELQRLKQYGAAIAGLSAAEGAGPAERPPLSGATDQPDPSVQKAVDTRVAANAEGDRKIAENQRKAAEEQKRRWGAMAGTFAQSIGKMVAGQRSFTDTIRDGYKRLMSLFQGFVTNMVRNWLMGLATNEAASQGFHAKEVLRDAKQAASKTYKVVSAIPVVGPFLAPPAAAAAFAGVMAFSAEKGAWNVGADNAPFLLHKEEMVLPAHLARPLRSLVQGNGAANLSAPPPTNDQPGQVHNHVWTIQAVDARGVRRLFMDNKSELAEAVGSAFRDGFRPR